MTDSTNPSTPSNESMKQLEIPFEPTQTSYDGEGTYFTCGCWRAREKNLQFCPTHKEPWGWRMVYSHTVVKPVRVYQKVSNEDRTR